MRLTRVTFFAVTAPDLLAALSKRLPREILHADAEALDAHAADATEDLRARPELVVKPRSEEEVRALLAAARELRIPITPQGALTGLSGGALAVRGGVALDLRAMSRILEIDRENLFAVVEAGCVTETLQDAVEAVGLFYPPDPSSRGSCTIGGNVAENAGGPRAAKYGTTGRYVSGLRVVLPGGSALALGGKNRKDVAGYDLLSLFIGSEGTLGVVTEATLRLLPRPAERRLLWASFGDEARALRAVGKLYAAGPEPSACEFMERRAAEVSAESLSLALPADADAHLFVEVDGFDEAGVARDAERIGERLLEAGASDVRVAMTDREQRDFWRLRRAVGEAVKRLGPYAEEDCAVPRAQLPELLRTVREIAQPSRADRDLLRPRRRRQHPREPGPAARRARPVAGRARRRGRRDLSRRRRSRRNDHRGAWRRADAAGLPVAAAPFRGDRGDARGQGDLRSRGNPESR